MTITRLGSMHSGENAIGTASSLPSAFQPLAHPLESGHRTGAQSAFATVQNRWQSAAAAAGARVSGDLSRLSQAQGSGPTSAAKSGLAKRAADSRTPLVATQGRHRTPHVTTNGGTGARSGGQDPWATWLASLTANDQGASGAAPGLGIQTLGLRLRA